MDCDNLNLSNSVEFLENLGVSWNIILAQFGE